MTHPQRQTETEDSSPLAPLLLSLNSWSTGRTPAWQTSAIFVRLENTLRPELATNSELRKAMDGLRKALEALLSVSPSPSTLSSSLPHLIALSTKLTSLLSPAPTPLQLPKRPTPLSIPKRPTTSPIQRVALATTRLSELLEAYPDGEAEREDVLGCLEVLEGGVRALEGVLDLRDVLPALSSLRASVLQSLASPSPDSPTSLPDLSSSSSSLSSIPDPPSPSASPSPTPFLLTFLQTLKSAHQLRSTTVVRRATFRLRTTAFELGELGGGGGGEEVDGREMKPRWPSSRPGGVGGGGRVGERAVTR